MAKAAQRLWMCLYAHPPQPAELLETLACIAFRYSHQVHLLQSSVVLEIAGSVKLFSSIPQLISKITTSIRALEATVAIGIAPNPYGALLLAKVSKPGHVRYAKFFPQNLAEIAITQSQIPEPVCSALASAGIYTLGALLSLPRANLRRRYGKACIEAIEDLLGERAFNVPRWQPREEFLRTVEFPFYLDNVSALRFPLRRMLQALALFLQARDGAVQRFSIRLLHQNAPSTEIAIGLLGLSRDAELLIQLSEQKLDQLTLSAPVLSMQIHASDLATAVQHTPDLFDPAANAKMPLPVLLERLRGKLGSEALRVLGCHADHRPEHASIDMALGNRRELPAAIALPSDLPARPAWLQTPTPIQPHQFEILSGPERIESGWWHSDCARDYYRARHRDGRLLWLFQRRHDVTEVWFLQGFD